MNTVIKGVLLTPFNVLYRISPRIELKLFFLLRMRRRLNLDNPGSYTEKLQWLKLNDSQENYRLMESLSDKYLAREYVSRLSGGYDILNTLYWHGFDPDAIPYDDLPDQFVIKVTHGATFNIIVRDKAGLDRGKASKLLKKWLSVKYLVCYGEKWYGRVRPRVIVEKYLENRATGELVDYKVHCFNGRAKLIVVYSERFEALKSNVYDREWNLLDVKFAYPKGKDVEKPECLEELIAVAEKLSEDFIYVRIDFYILDNKIVFGEYTFTQAAGYNRIEPHSFDLEMGSWINLPEKGGVRNVVF